MGDVITDLEQQLRRIGKDVQQFVEHFADDAEYDFKPSADIVDSTDTFVILIDLPGFTKSDIDLALKDQVLTISGERVIELSEGETFKRKERSTGTFARSFALPDDVDTKNIKAHFKNGELKITLPKSDISEDAEHIPIN